MRPSGQLYCCCGTQVLSVCNDARSVGCPSALPCHDRKFRTYDSYIEFFDFLFEVSQILRRSVMKIYDSIESGHHDSRKFRCRGIIEDDVVALLKNEVTWVPEGGPFPSSDHPLSQTLFHGSSSDSDSLQPDCRPSFNGHCTLFALSAHAHMPKR